MNNILRRRRMSDKFAVNMETLDKFGPSDVVLKVGDEKFPCHRKVLSKHSPYFHAMFCHNFTEKDQEEIEIKDLDPQAMNTVLRSICYGGKELLSKQKCDEILSVLQASCMLQFESLQQECVDLIVQKWLTVANCLPIMAHADALNLTNLYRKVRAQALWEFSKIKKSSNFLKLSVEELEDYLLDNGLHAANGEIEVFEACTSWLQDVEASNREQYRLRILKCVRFSDASPSDIRTMLLCTSLSESVVVSQILKCILQMKESKLLGTVDNGDSNTNLNTSASTQIEATAKMSSAMEDNIPDSSELNPGSDIDNGKEDIVSKAKELLCTPPRVLNLVPCVVGHCFDPPKPYLIAFKDNKLVPRLRLSKAEQPGSIEPNGYRVVTVKGQDLLILGGEFLWGHSNWNKSVWRYNQWSETWAFETSLEHQCRHQSVCCLGNEIYVMGGFGKYRVIADAVNRYNTISRNWKQCAPLPSPIYSAASCAFKGCIYVFGPQVWSYNPKRNNWITLTSHCSMGYNTAMPYGEVIYLTGMYSNELMIFDANLTEDSFKSVGHFKSNCTNTCLVQDIIYLFAVDLDKQLLVESYDIKKNTFQVLWSSLKAEDDNIFVDFSASSSIGCFPVIDY